MSPERKVEPSAPTHAYPGNPAYPVEAPTDPPRCAPTMYAYESEIREGLPHWITHVRRAGIEGMRASDERHYPDAKLGPIVELYTLDASRLVWAERLEEEARRLNRETDADSINRHEAMLEECRGLRRAARWLRSQDAP
jgi:hypothetical protein